MSKIFDRNELPNDVESLKDMFISTILCLRSTIEHLETRLAAQEDVHEQSPEQSKHRLESKDKRRGRSEWMPLTQPLPPDTHLVRVDALAEDVQHCGSCGAFLSKLSDEFEQLLEADPGHIVEELQDPAHFYPIPPCQDCLLLKITTMGSVLYVRCPLYVLESKITKS